MVLAGVRMPKPLNRVGPSRWSAMARPGRGGTHYATADVETIPGGRRPARLRHHRYRDVTADHPSDPDRVPIGAAARSRGGTAPEPRAPGVGRAGRLAGTRTS